MSMLRNRRARGDRRGFPITAAVGPNGGGKTASIVWDTLPSLDAGRPVLSTVRLLDYRNPRPCDDPTCEAPNHATHAAAHPSWLPFYDWNQLLDVEHCDVLMDEVTGVASSRESQGMPGAIANLLVQLRRRDVVLRWTAPNWARADVIIRECTQSVTACRGFLPVRVPVEEGQVERMWRHRRLFKWMTYDAAFFDDFTLGKRDQLKPWVRDFHWGPGSPVFSAYDTFDSVLSLAQVNEFGICTVCNGNRRRHQCKGHNDSLGEVARGEAEPGAPLAGPAEPSSSDSPTTDDRPSPGASAPLALVSTP